MTHIAVSADNGWVPASPCGPQCLPESGERHLLRRVRRVITLVAVLLLAVVTAPMLTMNHRARTWWLQQTVRLVVRAMGIRIEVRGPLRFSAGPSLVVANHVSWVEILALVSVHPVRLVAKHEVRNLFLIGSIASATGSLFIDRSGLRRLPTTLAEVTAALRAGHSVAVFPEGTTWCGAAAGRFRRAAFQSAIDAGVPVQPVGITLRRNGQAAPEAAFVGEVTLAASIGRVLRLSGLVCELALLPEIPPLGDRAGLARQAAAAIATVTGVPHPARPVRPSVAA